MGRSTSEKLRRRAIRENKRDFTLGRNSETMSLHERKTKTRKDKLEREYRKMDKQSKDLSKEGLFNFNILST